MDSEQIEKILQENYPSEGPLGMRQRVLEAALQELKPKKTIKLWHRVQFAFAAVLVGIILIANISDNTRRARMSETKDQKLNPNAITTLVAHRDIIWDVAPNALPPDSEMKMR